MSVSHSISSQRRQKKCSQLVNRVPLCLRAELFSLCCCADGLDLSAWLHREQQGEADTHHHWVCVYMCVYVCCFSTLFNSQSSLHTPHHVLQQIRIFLSVFLEHDGHGVYLSLPWTEPYTTEVVLGQVGCSQTVCVGFFFLYIHYQWIKKRSGRMDVLNSHTCAWRFFTQTNHCSYIRSDFRTPFCS